MGLGKSVQALVAIAVMQIETATIMRGQQHQPQHQYQRPRSLIVCPAVLTRHWQREIGKFFPDQMMRPLLYEDINKGTGTGTWAKSNSNTTTIATTVDEDDDHGCIYGGDVVIVSYEALRRDKGEYFTRDNHDHHNHHDVSATATATATATAPSSWLAVVLDEVGRYENNDYKRTLIYFITLIGLLSCRLSIRLHVLPYMVLCLSVVRPTPFATLSPARPEPFVRLVKGQCVAWHLQVCRLTTLSAINPIHESPAAIIHMHCHLSILSYLSPHYILSHHMINHYSPPPPLCISSPGTPNQNHVMDVWSVMQFLVPDYLCTCHQSQSRLSRHST